MVTVLLAVVVGKQALGPGSATGVALTIGGVALASFSPAPSPVLSPVLSPASSPGSGAPAEAGPRRSGVPYALAAMLAWGVATYILVHSAPRLGWFFPVAISRVATLAVVLTAGAGIVVGRRGGCVRCSSRARA